MKFGHLVLGLLPLLVAAVSLAEAPPATANSDGTYQQLRNLTLGSETVSVNNFDLKRESATFHLRSGTVCFVAPVQGKVTGAVFVGDGEMVLSPSAPSEIASLKLLTKGEPFNETFNKLVLRFTDATYGQINKGGTASTSNGCDPSALKDSQNTTRHKLKTNVESRILADVLSQEPGEYFLAFVSGKKYNGKELFTIDPHTASDQVEFRTYDENKYGVWAGFGLSGEGRRAVSRNLIHIEHQQIDATIEKNAHLTGKATTSFVSLVNGLRVIPFDLFSTLRVSSVTGENGQALTFIQEDKNDDADFAVILEKPLSLGEKYSITTTYSGKDAISNEGNGNYYPIARDDWYPNSSNSSLGEYTSYDMTFRIPKGMKIAATGSLMSETNDGNQDVTVWKSEAPQTVAGFNFGRFKVEEAKLTEPEYLVASYANEELPDAARGLYNTTAMMKRVLSEGQASVQIYSDYFGPSPYRRLALTQQTACDFGQSWPGLVWLPICSFFDATVRHELDLDFGDRGYWKVVAPHEVAHQWWGHTVGFSSYRDQWMSEGFADFSASLFLQMAYKDQKDFRTFWKDERDLLTDKNKEGFRAIDVGPLVMGYRLNNSKAGFNIARDLIYPKGAYVLHMIRMMMWDAQTRDQNFKALMHDFVSTYNGKAATTEDFKAVVEKHMTRDMNLDGNQRMDWFFNEYVYGTALPSYQLDATFDKDANGDVLFAFKIRQSGVDNNFKMVVPIYLELADGRMINLGRVGLVGNTSSEQKIPIKGLKIPPRRALLNYNYDILAAN